MKCRAALTTLALLPFIFTACASNSTNNNTSTTSQEPAIATETTTVHKDVKNWSGASEENTHYVVTTTSIPAPSGVKEARGLMGKADEDLNYIAVTIDNRTGTTKAKLSSVSFTDTDGKLIEFTLLSDFLNYQESAKDLTVNESNQIIDIHNAFSGEDYEVSIGEKKTFVLASTSVVPDEVTYGFINDVIALEPTNETVELDSSADAVSSTGSQPSASATVEGSDKTEFSGTTLKGNDISFRILPPEEQDTLNSYYQSQLPAGSWGRLCSVAAIPEQLFETGVSTVDADGDLSVWRSLTYAAQETTKIPYLESKETGTRLATESITSEGSQQCILVVSEDTTAASRGYDHVTVGRYMGTTALVDTVDIY